MTDIRSAPANTNTDSDAPGFSAEMFAAFWAAPDLSRGLNILADDITGYWPGDPEPVRGIEAYTAKIAELLDAAPDLHLDVVDSATVPGAAVAEELVFLHYVGEGDRPGRTVPDPRNRPGSRPRRDRRGERYPLRPGFPSPALRTGGAPAGPSPALWLQLLPDDTEHVALGVGQHHPAVVVAEPVPTDLTGPGRRQPRHFGINIGRTEVEVHAVFPGGGIGHLLESERGSFRQGHRGELVGEQLLGRATELVGPPSGQLCGISAVEGDHLNVERHTARP